MAEPLTVKLTARLITITSEAHATAAALHALAYTASTPEVSEAHRLAAIAELRETLHALSAAGRRIQILCQEISSATLQADAS